MIAPAGVTDSGYRKHFYLHPFQFFKRQVFKQRASGRGEVVLYRIGEGEEIASSVLQTVTQADEFLPAIDRDQPTVIEIALKLFDFAQHDKHEDSFLLNLVAVNPGFGACTRAANAAIACGRGAAIAPHDLQRHSHSSRTIRI